ncbi:uncharacterized protein K452DRAFT_284598 [Aplosporella prunicola CBS 121167]|uniref:Uncharacterized protein n=1 Tax=Aplosporella prunicola CBS 121167 TaxID=1176127 RepID=A0A6A6BP35_9PEZI|nr:uncharacterized protein K452DRAFT_284598 [Aplosporella prunicola CBS 121167]KAF2145203.1 hypothetical protein K452DRAFT_284598 [Aplosporella prunicola CBS 121167]
MQSITFAAAILAALPLASAGKATVINNCDSGVNLWTADTSRGQKGPHSVSAGGKWSEEYYMVGDGDASNGGVSIKLTTGNDCEGSITQFEYTYSASGSPNLWYDISNVNCKGDACPFYSGGFLLDGPTPVDCGPLTLVCDKVYNLWNDDLATHGMTSDEDLVLYLCGKDGGSAGSSASQSVASSSVAVSTPTSAAATTPATSTYVSPSTMITATPSSPAADVAVANVVSTEEDGEVVTEVVTEYATEYATAVVTQWAKRSPEPHVHRRAHQHNHPHWRK